MAQRLPPLFIASHFSIVRSEDMPTRRATLAVKILIFAFILGLFALNISVVAQTKPTPAGGQSSAPQEVRDVDFCELVRQPRRFFNQTVRIKAMWQQGHEFSYLTEERCPPRFRNEIAVRLGDKQDEATRTNLAKFQEREYGGRAMITAVGTLLNPGKYYGYYRYQFYISGLEDLTHVVEEYKGRLQAGNTYRAIVRGDKEIQLRLVQPLHIEMHYSVGIEWLNLSDFQVLEKLQETSGERTIVFSVINDQRRQMTDWRWSRILEIKIVRVE